MEDTNSITDVFKRLWDEFSATEALTDQAALEEQLKRIHEEFTTAIHTPGIADGADAIAKAEQEADAEEAAVRAMEEELAQLNAPAEPARPSTDVPLEEMDDATFEAEVRRPLQPSRQDFTAYAQQVSEAYAQLFLSRTVLKAVLMKNLEDIREERISTADTKFAEPTAWMNKLRQLIRVLGEAKVKAVSISYPVPECVEEEDRMLEEVEELATKAAEHVRKGEDQRRKRDERLRVFRSECNKLTLWCRQQLANLDAMQEPDHIQEYCATLVDNYATMSQNFTVLLESVETYVKANNVAVRRALLEADQLWFYLQVSTLERLSKTLYEIHPKSPLEVEVAKYAGYPEKLADFLSTLESYVQSLPESGAAVSVLTECDALPSAMREYSALPKEVRAFADRAQGKRAGYACFREAVLSRLTFLTPATDTVVDSKRRQQEFDNCVRELKAWASTAAHGESWRDIYSKIVEIKGLIKQEQQSIEDQAAAAG